MKEMDFDRDFMSLIETTLIFIERSTNKGNGVTHPTLGGILHTNDVLAQIFELKNIQVGSLFLALENKRNWETVNIDRMIKIIESGNDYFLVDIVQYHYIPIYHHLLEETIEICLKKVPCYWLPYPAFKGERCQPVDLAELLLPED